MQRGLPTPDSEKMLLKLERFVEKWKDVKDSSGRSIFTTETVPATQRLRRHILNECLSNIPPGGGTNKNKRLHS